MPDFKKFDFKKVKEHSRELRKSMTESEKLLWNELRGRKLSGYPIEGARGVSTCERW